MKQWMAVYTKPRNEKKVKEYLGRVGVEHYLPLQEVKRKWSDRWKVVQEPIIPSYVFVKVEEKERLQVLECPGVTNFVFWLGKAAIIPDREIEQIRFLLKEQSDTQLVQFEALKPGDRAKIDAGKFVGEDVTVQGESGKDFIVVLESLGMKLRLSKLNVKAI